MKTFGRLAALLLAFAAAPSFAVYNCTVTVSDITTVYDDSVATANVTTGSYTISCTRAAGDANSLAWSLGADDGQHQTGTSPSTNQVRRNGSNLLTYEVYRAPYSSPAVNTWGDVAGSTRFTGTLSFGASLTASQSGTFDLAVFAGQTGHVAGNYTDSVNVFLRSGINTLTTASFGVTVLTSNACRFVSPPSDINFIYTSFQAAVANASTTFSVRCTSALPYTMALDATSGTIASVNLSYALALSQTSATGNGVPQSYSINGTMAGGQTGKCATATCSASQTRTLTISY